MNQIILVEKVETLQNLEAPVLDYYESWQPNLFKILSYRAGCNELSNEYQLRVALVTQNFLAQLRLLLM